MDALSEKTIIDLFDQLVSEGVIVYGPYETIAEACGGYPVRHTYDGQAMKLRVTLS